jgi:hypothetical protein
VTIPDDEKANSPILYVLFGLLSVGMILGALVLLFFPPAIAAGLFVRGGVTGRPALRWIGGALFAVWLVVFWRVGRRIMSPPRPPDA